MLSRAAASDLYCHLGSHAPLSQIGSLCARVCTVLAPRPPTFSERTSSQPVRSAGVLVTSKILVSHIKLCSPPWALSLSGVPLHIFQGATMLRAVRRVRCALVVRVVRSLFFASASPLLRPQGAGEFSGFRGYRFRFCTPQKLGGVPWSSGCTQIRTAVLSVVLLLAFSDSRRRIRRQDGLHLSPVSSPFLGLVCFNRLQIVHLSVQVPSFPSRVGH